MRSTAAIGALLALATPAAAELNTYYEGVQRVAGKEVPLKAAFCVDKERVVMRMQGASAMRMVYMTQEKKLRLIDDSGKKVADLGAGGLGGDMMAEMDKQLAQMPESRREQAKAMMKSAMGSMRLPDPPHYVGTNEKQMVLDHECTRVDIFRGERRVGEYWGSTSKDFQLSDEERANVVAMNGILGNLSITATNVGGEGTRTFAWDTSKDGYPLISRCVEDSTVTLEVKMVSFDRKPLDPSLWKIPSGYRQESMGDADGMTPKGRKGRRN